MTEQTSLIEFPCDFTLKIIGMASPAFLADMLKIIRKHYPDFDHSQLNHKASKQNNYTSITVVVHAKDKPTLDALYCEVSQHPMTKMVL